MKNIFIAIFEDNSNFIGSKNYYNTKWNDIPNKKIRTLFYRIPSNDYLTLSNYEEYYHMIEATQDIFGGNKKTIEYAYIMGKLKNKINVFKINLYNDLGNIKMKQYDINDNYIKKLNKDTWKKGLKAGE